MPRLQKADVQMREDQALDANFVQALYRGIEIIRAFGNRPERLTLSDLSRATNLPRATVRRTLMTLAHMGYVESDGRLFWLLPKILELSAAYLTSNPVTTIFQPACDRLAREFGHTVSTAILDRDDTVVVAYAHGQSMSANETWIGLRLPSYCTALGRVLLSGLSDSELDRYFAVRQLEAKTPFTETDPQRVRRAVEAVRIDGFSFVDQEASLGTRMVAVPLRRFDGKVVAALGFGSRVELASAETMRDDFLPNLLKACKDLSSDLT